MSDIQCPYCQCQITLLDSGTRRFARVLTWFCLGGLAVALTVWLFVPALTPPPTDPTWIEETRRSHKDNPAKADELIASRRTKDRLDWANRLSPAEQAALNLGTALKTLCILLLCAGVCAAILALTIRPQPQQKRPPPEKLGTDPSFRRGN